MGNACLHRLDNQKQKMIKVKGYPKLHNPSKLNLEPSIQNITQNLDTFEEDFFKCEFKFDISPHSQRDQCTRKVKLGSTIEEIKRINLIECPSHFDEKLDFQQDNSLNLIMNLNNSDRNVILLGQKRNHSKKTKQKGSLQKIEKPKSILKTHNQQHNSSYSCSNCIKSLRTVTFSIDTYNSRNIRSLSPLLSTFQGRLQQDLSRSMTYLQQFPYL